MSEKNKTTPKRVFNFLPLGSVKPDGWLLEQLQIQADGLSGHLDEIHPDLGPESGWLGGKGESWEIGPYWLDGLVPMAFLLDDEDLKKKARKWVNWTLTNLGKDGWIGPVTDNEDKWWPRAVMLKVLTQYFEATGDRRVEPAITDYLNLMQKRLKTEPLKVWGKFRWGEYLATLLWFRDSRPGPFFTDLPGILHNQGYNWSDHFNYFRIEEKMRVNYNLASHVVNHAMAVKYPALWSIFSGTEEDKKAAYAAIEMLDRYHGTATGLFTGDEHLAGLNPSQGTELCAVVEFMYSLSFLVSIYGDTAFADRLESVCYNNLPAAFSADMWAHQYDQQSNQVLCSVEKRDWSNGPDANIFGLAPNYKCCMGNFSQGWPKFIANMWMATPDKGLAAVALGPSKVKTTINGSEVSITEKTDYPFYGGIEFNFQMKSPAKFPLSIRIPEWAKGARLSVNEEPQREVKPGTFHRLDRLWNDGDNIILNLPMKVRVTRRFNNSAAIYRGPLSYSLRISSSWDQIGGELPHADYSVTPVTPWNYALVLNEDRPDSSFDVSENPVRMPCFSEMNSPVTITVKAKQVPSWGMDGASAAPPPQSPVETKNAPEDVDLIPYGAAKLRITEFPVTK